MRPQTPVWVVALSALAGLTAAANKGQPRERDLEDRGIIDDLVSNIAIAASDVVSSVPCAGNKLAALMGAYPALAAPFCSSSVGVVIKTPTATVTAKATK